MNLAPASLAPLTLEPAIQKLGREMMEQVQGQTPNLLSRRGLQGQMMKWSMKDEAFKVQLFRFVDLLPSLHSSRELTHALKNYLSEKPRNFPFDWAWRLGVNGAGLIPWLAAPVVRSGVLGMALQFIVGATPEEAAKKLKKSYLHGTDFTVDLLGEAVMTEPEANVYAARAMELLNYLIAVVPTWPLRDEEGAFDQLGVDDEDWPRVNLSVKISAFSSQINPADPKTSIELLKMRLRPILRLAKEGNAFVNFDMEQIHLKALTIQLFKEIFSEPEFAQKPRAGLALQAYLVSSPDDVAEMIDWAREHKRRIAIRLVKGAQWESEVIGAEQKGWPMPVFMNKAATDANYEKLTRLILENDDAVQAAFGTHNIRSIATAIACAEALGLPPRRYEFQMLYGMAELIKEMLLARGHRVREYSPVGDLIPGMAYLVRRLIENTSNEGFLRSSFVDRRSTNDLLANPEEKMNESPQKNSNAIQNSFKNEPPLDFTLEATRQQVNEAIHNVRAHLGKHAPLFINGKQVDTAGKITSVNPSKPNEIIGTVAKAGKAEAEAAIRAAKEAQPKWAAQSVENRAAFLERIGELMRKNRTELMALEMLEVGKTWPEADGDITEAIDFCFYYAREVRRLGKLHPTEKTPGEESYQHWIPRGVAVVIAPWNFPLAILCGMTTAALVTGNTVVFKPAEPSVMIAARFMDLLNEAGAPAGVVNFLPGSGREIGDLIVEHPLVDMVVFTGSMDVGLRINERAGRTPKEQRNVKKVVCEMGGKNAMIVDSDADLDEAVIGILTSAFGYQGQKCSALSRLIVVEGCYEKLMHRLVEAAETLPIGAPEHPFTKIGPIVSQSARDGILKYIEIGKKEATLAYEGKIPAEYAGGYYIPPTIFTNVTPEMTIAREEIFGPVLAVMKAKDFDEALAMANHSAFALTAGIYTRDPKHLQKAAEQLVAGNIYINRPITGAMVGRHPFGGFMMSGGGTKAGGADYLAHFMFPRVVTENTVRRGFAPAS